MRKRVCAALLALLLTGWPFCPTALAETLPAPPADDVITEQPEQPVPTPEPEPSPAPLESAETGNGTDSSDGTEIPLPKPTSEPLAETPPAEETPEPTPDQTGDGQPPEDATVQPPNEPPPENDGCNTIEELAELVAQDAGGTVTVTGDLALAEGDDVWLDVQTPVTIDLGPYGITVPEGATLALSGPITLTGDGASGPLLSVSGYLTAMDGAVIRAAGERAVAVRLTGGGWNSNRAAVEVTGANACAVESDGPMALYRVQLTARGENALCVRASAPVRLILCRAESDGALADAPALTLDGTAASPEPEDAELIRRVAVPHDYKETNGLWIEVGAAQEELAALLESNLGDNRFEYGLVDEARQEDDLLHVTAMTWTGGDVDLDTPGVYWFTGVPEDWALGGVAPPEKRVPVIVADPEKPSIQAGYQVGSGVRLQFFRPIRAANRLTLWYSTDQGHTWRDAGELPEAEIGPEGAVLPTLPEADRDYLFRLKVEGGPMAGRSNTLRCLYYDNYWGWGGGGDWDGGDWGDQGELPDDNPAPPPDREPEDDPPPAPEPDDSPSEPDHEDGGDDDWQDDEEERPARPGPTPTPRPDLPEIEISFLEPVPTPTPDPVPTPEVTAPPAETTPPATPTPPAATPAPPSQPPRPTPTTAEPTPPPLPEGATASLTGRDLEAQKLANPAGVTLTGDGLKATLPYALTDALELGPEGVLAVRLAAPNHSSFEVRFWADGKEVADFGSGAFTITIPVEESEGMEHFCTAPDGTVIAASALAGGRAEFDLTATGVYTLSASIPKPALSETPQSMALAETAKPEEPEAQSVPILPLLGALALAAAGGLLRRRRRGGR